jgi:hypothetical protein
LRMRATLFAVGCMPLLDCADQECAFNAVDAEGRVYRVFGCSIKLPQRGENH